MVTSGERAFDSQSVSARVSAAVAEYRANADVRRLVAALREIAARAERAALASAVDPYRDVPEIIGPIYEVIVEREPSNAQALVILANAYWLSGRGPEVVGELATRALSSDPENRGAWHLWAITSPTVRDRMARWSQVVERFPVDDLARAALADTAASVASADDDPVALKLAIDTYRELLARSTQTAQRLALENAIRTLTGGS